MLYAWCQEVYIVTMCQVVSAVPRSCCSHHHMYAVSMCYSTWEPVHHQLVPSVRVRVGMHGGSDDVL